MQQMEKDDPRKEEIVPGKGMGFAYFLSTIQNGDLHAEVTKDLQALGASLNQHFQDFRGAPKGEITLKFKFALKKGVVEVLVDKTVKHPKAPDAGAILYIDAQNNFCQDNPQQRDMGFPRTGPRAVS